MEMQRESRRRGVSNGARRRRRWVTCCLAAVTAAVAIPGASPGAVTHRYSFNDGTADDGVGAAHGTLVHGATVSGGQLILANSGFSNAPSTGQYADLPNNIARTRDVTLEGWVTWGGGGDYQWVFDIGTTTVGEIVPGNNATDFTASNYFGITPRADGTFQNSFAGTIWKDGNYAFVTEAAKPLPPGAAQHVALVIRGDPDGAANGANGTISLYRNGAHVGTAASQYDPALFDQANTWVGRSSFQGNPFYAGSVDDFRIYDEALSAAQVGDSFRAGPNAVPEPGAGLAVLGLGALALTRRRTK